jgi:hypothetical protein
MLVKKKKREESYAQQAARYRYFIVNEEGRIIEGNEFLSDAKDALREYVLNDDMTKHLVSRVRADKVAMTMFYKRHKVSERQQDIGQKQIKNLVKMGAY